MSEKKERLKRQAEAAAKRLQEQELERWQQGELVRKVVA